MLLLQVLMVALDFRALDCVDSLIARLVGNCFFWRKKSQVRQTLYRTKHKQKHSVPQRANFEWRHFTFDDDVDRFVESLPRQLLSVQHFMDSIEKGD